MSWTSTADYYRQLNTRYQERAGGLHSAPLLLWSFDFAELEVLQTREDWDELAERTVEAARALAGAGAGALLICANTMHKIADRVAQGSGLEVLHIADATGAEIQRLGFERVGLLGTRFTMGEDFYRERLERRFGLEVIVPDEPAQARVDRIIYDELCRDRILGTSRDELHQIVAALADRGAQAAVLACTELPLLADATACPVPLIDTIAVHVRQGVDWLLS
jgi:aspartate racemase